uniref:Ubiquitin-activating enzyme E1 C-terminal domain-containing protein n=1 Tax=Pseudo-nitzschia arenysensis TaxID=697910 RepID=A0A7S0F7B5_9STRA
MGARAHGLIRSSTIYVDGPIRSGLLWESIKNLALSGVGKLVVVVDESENGYHSSDLDDLGAMYIRGALSELGRLEEDSSSDLTEVLVDFIRRLNPALEVSTISKADLRSGSGNDGVFLSVDRPYTQQKAWNDWCRQESSSTNIKFVSAETAGVYGKIFCDFGSAHEIHDIDGETPLVVPLDKVEEFVKEGDSKKINLLVKSVEGERHDVSRDDVVVFQRSDGSIMEEIPCTVTKVLSPERIEVQIVGGSADMIQQINNQAVTFQRQKQIQEVSFLSLEETLSEATATFQGEGRRFPTSEIFTPCDLDKSFDETRRKAVFECFQALDSFVQTNNKLPSGDDERTVFFKSMNLQEEPSTHCQQFLRTCRAKFVPLQAIFGAIASQECLKAVSGLYNPIQQFLLYDCDEVLTDEEVCLDDEEESTGMSYILGSEISRKLENQKLFVVGSGAIGCEILKNIAAMGTGTGNSGRVVVTDMDTIEKSNLSRQLLFRDSDIGKFKSKAAEEALLRMNPSVEVESHASKVGDEEEEGPFDSKFWSEKVDVVLNALDNMEARLFMDGQCVSNQKALVDAGTLGSKGNVQVVVPHQSESYGSSVDPPEPAIPVCTLKNFPYAISHTIQWGRDLFDGLFVRRPNQANQYAQEFLKYGNIDFDGLVQKIDHDLSEEAALEIAKELSEDLSTMIEERNDNDVMRKVAVEWAMRLGKGLFHETMVALLDEHPVDELDDEGELFWSGSRKPPKPLSFSLNDDDAVKQQEEINKNMIDFVRSAARLRYETYTGIPTNTRTNLELISEKEAKEALVDASENEGESIFLQRKDPSKSSKRDEIRRQLSSLNGVLNNDAEPSAPETVFSAEFEKDDESNDHITFITAASNLRAICYGIAPVDAMETRKVAGKIIPAMITTTAFVSALSCLELIKVTQGLPLNRHRNAFINLALPFFAFTAPLPAEEYQGVRGETHTLWDKIDIKEGKKAAKSGGLTLKRFLRRIQKKAYADDPDAVQVSNISIGPIMVYANFLHEDDEELLSTSIWDVIENAVQSGEEFDEEFSRDGPTANDDDKKSSFSVSSIPYIDLVVSVEDTETFEEVELPQVRLFRSK